jgi:hypothetical protein
MEESEYDLQKPTYALSEILKCSQRNGFPWDKTENGTGIKYKNTRNFIAWGVRYHRSAV